jgi:hypothetical protein
MPNIVVLDGHPVPSEVAKTLDPSILESRDRFVQECHHGVGEVNKRQHMLEGSRQAMPKQF